MYTVERKAKDVVISGPRGKVTYTTSQDSFVVFKEGEGLVVKQVKDLKPQRATCPSPRLQGFQGKSY